jgi:hypothetical protein
MKNSLEGLSSLRQNDSSAMLGERRVAKISMYVDQTPRKSVNGTSVGVVMG